MRAFGLGHDLGDERVDGDVESLARLVAAGQDLIGQPVAGLVDLGDQIGAAQFQFEQQRVGRILQQVVDLFGALGDAVDDGRGAMLEFGGEAVDPLVQHLVDAIGKFDELVVNVAGLEVQAGGQPLAGVEHRARGFRARFFEPVQ